LVVTLKTFYVISLLTRPSLAIDRVISLSGFGIYFSKITRGLRETTGFFRRKMQNRLFFLYPLSFVVAKFPGRRKPSYNICFYFSLWLKNVFFLSSFYRLDLWRCVKDIHQFMHYFKTYVENPIYLPYETHNHSKHLQSFGNRSFKPWNYSQSFNFQFLCWRKLPK